MDRELLRLVMRAAAVREHSGDQLHLKGHCWQTLQLSQHSHMVLVAVIMTRMFKMQWERSSGCMATALLTVR
jgi:hypothetical protein